LPGSSVFCERFEDLLRDLRRREALPCVVQGRRVLPRGGLEDLRRVWGCRLRDAGARPGEVVGLEADLSFESIAVLLAILAKGSAAALIAPGDPRADDFLRGVGALRGFRQASSGAWSLEERLPPFAPFERPRGPALLFLSHGPDEAGGATLVAPLDDVLVRVARGRGGRVSVRAGLHRPEGADLVFSALVGGGCLVLDELPSPRTLSAAGGMRESG
jgi:hypothetical protein